MTTLLSKAHQSSAVSSSDIDRDISHEEVASTLVKKPEILSAPEGDGNTDLSAVSFAANQRGADAHSKVPTSGASIVSIPPQQEREGVSFERVVLAASAGDVGFSELVRLRKEQAISTLLFERAVEEGVLKFIATDQFKSISQLSRVLSDAVLSPAGLRKTVVNCMAERLFSGNGSALSVEAALKFAKVCDGISIRRDAVRRALEMCAKDPTHFALFTALKRGEAFRFADQEVLSRTVKDSVRHGFIDLVIRCPSEAVSSCELIDIARRCRVPVTDVRKYSVFASVIAGLEGDSKAQRILAKWADPGLRYYEVEALSLSSHLKKLDVVPFKVLKQPLDRQQFREQFRKAIAGFSDSAVEVVRVACNYRVRFAIRAEMEC